MLESWKQKLNCFRLAALAVWKGLNIYYIDRSLFDSSIYKDRSLVCISQFYRLLVLCSKPYRLVPSSWPAILLRTSTGSDSRLILSIICSFSNNFLFVSESSNSRSSWASALELRFRPMKKAPKILGSSYINQLRNFDICSIFLLFCVIHGEKLQIIHYFRGLEAKQESCRSL